MGRLPSGKPSKRAREFARAEAAALEQVEQGAPGWEEHARFLEEDFPERWGPAAEVRITRTPCKKY